jgi:hypothetical protein
MVSETESLIRGATGLASCNLQLALSRTADDRPEGAKWPLGKVVTVRANKPLVVG